MSTQIQRRKGTTAEHSTFTGAEAELTVDTTKDTVVVHDGSTVGGHPLQKQFPPIGSAAAPTYTFTGDTNTGIYSPGADQVAISTNGTGRLLVDASGNVGVNTINPQVYAGYKTLEIKDTTGGAFRLRDTGTAILETIVNASEAYIKNVHAAPLWIGTSNTERLRITSDGRLGLGTSSPSTFGRFALVASGSGSKNGIGISNGGFNGSPGSPSELPLIEGFTSAGTLPAGIYSLNAFNSYTDHWLAFKTTNRAGTTATRLTIDAEGRVGLGTSSPGYRLDVNSGATTDVAAFTSTGSSADIYLKDSGTTLGNTRIRATSGELRFITGLSARMTIDSSGKVGIGTTSPGAILDVGKANNAGDVDFRFFNRGAGSANSSVTLGLFPTNTATRGGKIVMFADNPGGGQFSMRFLTSTTTAEPSERMRIDTAGRLLIGTSTDRTGYRVQIEGTDENTSSLSLTRNSNDSSGSGINLGKSRGTSLGSNTVVIAGDRLGSIRFRGTDGSALLTGALIEAKVDTTPGANDLPTRLEFSTTADGASSPTERMRITSGGEVYIPYVAAGTWYSSASLRLYTGAETTAAGSMESTTTAGGTRYHCIFSNSNGVVGSISTSGSATAYNTSSDYRLKENVVPLTGAAERLNQLQVHRFNFIADSGRTVDGFIAHEAQAVVPECVTGTKDEVDDEGNPVYQGIDQSKLVPLLTAALQEALAEIESLKARVTALEP